ncbi:MAG: prolyl oligopeptidase family serine peptidase, partial [Solirubrobacterales bacterium]|nr:prolyl oligopeptidase family serine peptidase [Solirubrobacterales bacterium]
GTLAGGGAVLASWRLARVLLKPHEELVVDHVAASLIGADRARLTRTPATLRPGLYGMHWDGGHAVLGEVLSDDGEQVTRRVLSLEGDPKALVRVTIDPAVWDGDPASALGIEFEEVSYSAPVGEIPAWLVPGAGSEWVIFVHGIDGTRQDGLRAVSALRRLGIPVLVISYRNDFGAPLAPAGRITLGMEEWEDLDAACRWALAEGAERLVLFGQSMGAAIVGQFMARSSVADRVAALVFDAPALDWAGILASQAGALHVRFLSPVLRWAIGAQIPVDWAALDLLSRAEEYQLPLLVFHGEEDTLVPASMSARFVAAAGGQATYVPVPDAGHIESWNVDPEEYGAHLERFLGPLLDDGPETAKPR